MSSRSTVLTAAALSFLAMGCGPSDEVADRAWQSFEVGSAGARIVLPGVSRNERVVALLVHAGSDDRAPLKLDVAGLSVAVAQSSSVSEGLDAVQLGGEPTAELAIE